MNFKRKNNRIKGKIKDLSLAIKDDMFLEDMNQVRKDFDGIENCLLK